MNTKSIQSKSILEALFTSQARVDILKLFFIKTSDRHYLREIATLTDHPVRAVQRELSRLEDAGILVSEREGNRKYFRPDPDSPVFSELRGLLVKAAGFAEVIRDELGQESGEIQVAFIFGSFAKGTESADSDIDLFVLGGITGRQLAKLLKPAKDTLEREINPVLIGVDEFRAKLEDQDTFLLDLMQAPKLFIVGDEDELTAFASPKAA